MELDLKVKENILILESLYFNITYSKKDRVLIIQKDNIMISGVKDMLTISTTNDSETFFIDKTNLNNFKIELNDNNIDLTIYCVNYVTLKISNLSYNEIDLKKIRYAICNLIYFYINDNFSHNEKMSKMSKIISF